MRKSWNNDKKTAHSLSGLYLKMVIASLLFCFTGCSNSKTPGKEIQTSKEEKMEYYCPMHPEVHQDHPGKCPKPECSGMELVLKNNESDLESALKPVSSNVLSKAKLINPVYKKLPVIIETLGYVDYDSYGKYDISSRYSGRIDKLYIRYNYQTIKKGEAVFEIYSADLVNAQENLLYLLKNNPEEKDLIEAARQKLKLLQLTDEQVREIENSKKIKNTITVYSKYDGHIHEMMDLKMLPSSMNDYAKSPLLSVKEGMYVERGKVLFNVVNPYKAVAMLKIKSLDIGKVRLGQPVEFTINNDSNMKMNGAIDFIEPVFSTNSKSMMVRVNFNNEDHRHKIGSLVNAKIKADSLETIWIPASAVLDLGKNKMVWVWKDDNFKAVKVETGVKVNNWVEIYDGLTENDKIASEAHFLSDSESFIKINEDE